MDRFSIRHIARPAKGQAGLRRLRTLAEDCRNELARTGGNTSEVDALLAHLNAETGLLRAAGGADGQPFAREDTR